MNLLIFGNLMKRVFILVLDSLGIGYTKDSHLFYDEGSNTLNHIAEFCYKEKANFGRRGSLFIPNLTSLGLGLAAEAASGHFPLGLNKNTKIIANYGYASPISFGKDTISGHWEIAGVPVLYDWHYFKDKKYSFPNKILNEIVNINSLSGYLGNCHSSGTSIISDLGEDHIKTKKPIFYTSSDSVFQIACHEDYFGLDSLYSLCKVSRNIFNKSKYNVARVIARPFSGQNNKNYIRNSMNRKDFSVKPHDITVMKKLLIEKQGQVVGIGKISDIYNNYGITYSVKADGICDIFNKTINEIKIAPNNSIVFANFVDFDSLWGHRRNVAGYARDLEYFDYLLPKILSLIKDNDLLIITSDHGCDPTWIGFNHTRECIPILIYSNRKKNNYLGHSNTFSDIAQTLAYYFNLSDMKYGKNILF